VEALIALLVIAVLVIIVLAKSVTIVPQAQAKVVERFGRYSRTLSPGLAILVPFADRVRATIDLREQVISFPPQPVITADNLQVGIDTVVYFQVTDPRLAVYGIANYITGMEQLTTTTLRNVVGGLNLEGALTGRDGINSQLRSVLDGTTGPWGLRVARVEIKAIDPPLSIQDSMEKQMRADRDKRATILTAEGQRQSAIMTAEGQKASQILAAEGHKTAAILEAEAERQSRILRAEGERAALFLQAQGQAKSIETVFQAIHDGKPDQGLLAYQYLQTLPKIAQGDANKMWIVPSEFSSALEGLANLGGAGKGPAADGEPRRSWLDVDAQGSAPASAPAQRLDTSDWFESRVPRAADQPEAKLEMSTLDDVAPETPHPSMPSTPSIAELTADVQESGAAADPRNQPADEPDDGGDDGTPMPPSPYGQQGPQQGQQGSQGGQYDGPPPQWQQQQGPPPGWQQGPPPGYQGR
jgi:regulator of protease activity HflC (stomatin/prohibitin superfamily)